MAGTAFENTMGRINGLLSAHQKLHGKQGRPPQYVSDVLRGALVLTIAALDAHILDCMGGSLRTLIRKDAAGEAVTKWLKENPADVMSCFAQPDPVAALAAVYREKKLSAITFQKVVTIERTLSSVVGCGSPFPDAAVLLSAASGKAVTGAEVAAELDLYVARRHRITHDGDVTTSGRTTPITIRYVRRAQLVVECVATATETTVAGHLQTL